MVNVKQWLVIGIFMLCLCHSLSARALDTVCAEKYFNEFISALEDYQSYPLQLINDKDEDVKNAVKIYVEWGSASSAVNQAVFASLLQEDPGLIPTDVTLALLGDSFLTSNCNKVGYDKSACYEQSLSPGSKAFEVLSKSPSFQAALTRFNAVQKEQLDTAVEEKIKRGRLMETVMTRDVTAAWMESESAKTSASLGRKTFSDLGCQ